MKTIDRTFIMVMVEVVRVHVQRLGGWVGSHALFGLITLFGVVTSHGK